MDRVEGSGDNGKPGRTGSHPRVAVTRGLMCAVGALVITPRDIISHRFTLEQASGAARQVVPVQLCVDSGSPSPSSGRSAAGPCLRLRAPSMSAGSSPPPEPPLCSL